MAPHTISLNNALNANSFENNALGIVQSPFKQNSFGADFGVRVGGFPSSYNGKNKTFFFFSYEGARKRNDSTAALRTLPTEAFKSGDFLLSSTRHSRVT